MKLVPGMVRHNYCGEVIRQLRLKKGMSQEQLATSLQLAGLSFSQKSVSRLESGKRLIPDYELPFLANVLGVTVSELFRLCEEYACDLGIGLPTDDPDSVA